MAPSRRGVRLKHDRPDKPLREQIAQAMAKIERELEILQGPSTIGGPADNRQVIAELQAEYQALKDARAIWVRMNCRTIPLSDSLAAETARPPRASDSSAEGTLSCCASPC